MSPLLEAARRLLRRGVTPAVLIAFAVGGPRQVRELVGEGALAQLRTLLGEPEALALPLQKAVLGEADQERTERRGGHRQKSGELRRRGTLRQALRAHPVHRLQHLV